MKKYTIKDIAKLAGVSKGTVDRVIHKRGKVSPEALEKVTKLLEEIDYRPNPMARNLKNNKIYKICIVLPNPEEDSYWKPCEDVINEAIKEYMPYGIDIQLFLYSPESVESFQKINGEVLKIVPDAVLLAPLFYRESISVAQEYLSAGIKVSSFNNQVKSNQVINFVGQNLLQSGRVAAQLMHMIVPDKSTIVVCHIDESLINAVHMQEKERGFKDYFGSLNKGVYNVLTLSSSKEELDKTLNDLLISNSSIAGIFVTTSKAYKVIEILNKNNYSKLKVIGYDLLNENIDYLKNGLLSFLIHQSPNNQIHIGLTHLVEHFLFDKEIPNEKLLPIDIINAENLSSYIEN